jgi:hypothetical protein
VKTHSLRNLTATLAVAALVATTVGVMRAPSETAEGATAHNAHRNVDKRSPQGVEFRNQIASCGKTTSSGRVNSS